MQTSSARILSESIKIVRFKLLSLPASIRNHLCCDVCGCLCSHGCIVRALGDIVCLVVCSSNQLSLLQFVEIGLGWEYTLLHVTELLLYNVFDAGSFLEDLATLSLVYTQPLRLHALRQADFRQGASKLLDLVLVRSVILHQSKDLSFGRAFSYACFSFICKLPALMIDCIHLDVAISQKGLEDTNKRLVVEPLSIGKAKALNVPLPHRR
mmetsp:Transcript_31577/g.71034  ORF Transcript_31577/g.71034 Transcript_31577/m.71034 type:complete len:210 (+) Transcript_31577:882-1511(+)